MLCVCFALFIGCGSDSDDTDSPTDSIAGNLPNLDDLKVREQILAEAIYEYNLKLRNSPSGELLYYALNQQVPYTGWVKGIMSDGVVPFSLWQVQNGKRHGIYLRWYNSQETREKGVYKNGFKNGTWTYQDNYGRKSEGTFKNDAESGWWNYWHDNGQKWKEGVFKDGAESGLWTYWHDNGQKWKEGSFKDGAESGLWTYWYDNGQKWQEGVFKDGVESGLWAAWDQNGQKFSKIVTGNSVNSVAFSPDGNTIASGSEDSTVLLFDVATGTYIHTLEGNLDSVNSVAFSPDGKTLASGSHDGTIRFWDVP